MAEGDILDLTDLTQLLHPPPAGHLGAEPPEPRSLKEAERALILQTLQSVQGNRTRAAELLGISLRGLYYKFKALQREVGGSRAGIPLSSEFVKIFPSRRLLHPHPATEKEFQPSRGRSTNFGAPGGRTLAS